MTHAEVDAMQARQRLRAAQREDTMIRAAYGHSAPPRTINIADDPVNVEARRQQALRRLSIARSDRDMHESHFELTVN